MTCHVSPAHIETDFFSTSSGCSSEQPYEDASNNTISKSLSNSHTFKCFLQIYGNMGDNPFVLLDNKVFIAYST